MKLKTEKLITVFIERIIKMLDKHEYKYAISSTNSSIRISIYRKTKLRGEKR